MSESGTFTLRSWLAVVGFVVGWGRQSGGVAGTQGRWVGLLWIGGGNPVVSRCSTTGSYQYCLGGFLEGSVLGKITAFAGLTVPVLWFARLDIPGWGGGMFMCTIVSLSEAIRQRERFDAFVELGELENQKAMKRLQAVGVPSVPDAWSLGVAELGQRRARRAGARMKGVLCCALSGLGLFSRGFSWGVAPGYHILARWAVRECLWWL
jgi:hypothetical protein